MSSSFLGWANRELSVLTGLDDSTTLLEYLWLLSDTDASDYLLAYVGPHAAPFAVDFVAFRAADDGAETEGQQAPAERATGGGSRRNPSKGKGKQKLTLADL